MNDKLDARASLFDLLLYLCRDAPHKAVNDLSLPWRLMVRS